MPWPLNPQGKSCWYPLDRRLDGPQSQSGHSGEEKNTHGNCNIYSNKYMLSKTKANKPCVFKNEHPLKYIYILHNQPTTVTYIKEVWPLHITSKANTGR
jgi:hypothetical protein